MKGLSSSTIAVFFMAFVAMGAVWFPSFFDNVMNNNNNNNNKGLSTTTMGGNNNNDKMMMDKITGWSFPLQQDFIVAGKKLQLLGVGYRKKAIINVYTVALYGSKPVTKALINHDNKNNKKNMNNNNNNNTTRCDIILNSKGTKAIQLNMNIGLNSKLLSEALTNIDNITTTTKNKLSNILLPINKLNKGESMTIEMKYPNSISIIANHNMLLGTIKDDQLYYGLLNVYLGPKSVSPTLQQNIEQNNVEL